MKHTSLSKCTSKRMARALRLASLPLVCIAMLTQSPAAMAFDGKRTGFLLGVGGGFHFSNIESENSFFLNEGSSGGFALALKIGAGVNERLAVYFLRDGQFDSNVVFGLTGLGATYYFRDAGPSAYLTGGLGFGDITDDDIDNDSALGAAVMFGGGYAFVQGFHLDGSVMVLSATLDNDDLEDIDYDTVSLRVMAGYTWF